MANSASGSFLVFRTTSSIVSGRITSTSLPSLTNTVVQAIGGSEPTVANHRLEETIGLRSRFALLNLSVRNIWNMHKHRMGRQRKNYRLQSSCGKTGGRDADFYT